MIVQSYPVEWQMLKEAADDHARRMAKDCSPQGRKMIRSESQKFAQQAPPTDSAEIAIRRNQRNVIPIRIQVIAAADRAALQNPRVAGEIFGEAARLCKMPLPTTDGERKA